MLCTDIYNSLWIRWAKAFPVIKKSDLLPDKPLRLARILLITIVLPSHIAILAWHTREYEMDHRHILPSSTSYSSTRGPKGVKVKDPSGGVEGHNDPGSVESGGRLRRYYVSSGHCLG
jgi:hypothetical protein